MPARAFVFDAYGTLYDVQSVAAGIEAEFPDRGELITQIWRLKQLEYTWLRSVMGEFRDFAVVTEQALRFALGVVGLKAEASTIARLVQLYDRLDPYPDATATLAALAPYRRVILSNGSRAMLAALTRHSGLDRNLDAILSVDDCQIYKPHPSTYALVEQHLAIAPADTIFVSSNPFDVAGAKRFGFRVAWVARVAPDDLQAELARSGPIGATTMFKTLRTQPDELGHAADWRITSLRDLTRLAFD